MCLEAGAGKLPLRGEESTSFFIVIKQTDIIGCLQRNLCLFTFHKEGDEGRLFSKLDKFLITQACGRLTKCLLKTGLNKKRSDMSICSSTTDIISNMICYF